MKRPPWHDDLLAVAALPIADQALVLEAFVLPALAVFVGQGAWQRAKLARQELLDAEAFGHGRGAVTCLPPGDSPWAYDWRAVLNQTVLVYLLDDDRALLRSVGEALLAAGARRVFGVDGRQERPRPIIAEIAARRAA
jgi:hypothetical protein